MAFHAQLGDALRGSKVTGELFGRQVWLTATRSVRLKQMVNGSPPAPTPKE